MAQRRCPDTGGIGDAAQIELRLPRERVADEPPVHQVARVMNRHAGKPFERRVGDVIILADAADARIRMKTGKDWILDFSHCSIQFCSPAQRVQQQFLKFRMQPDFQIVSRRQHANAARTFTPRPAGGLPAMFGTGMQKNIGRRIIHRHEIMLVAHGECRRPLLSIGWKAFGSSVTAHWSGWRTNAPPITSRIAGSWS